MTIKEQILRLLNKAQHPMTNREIAKKIKRPEASVRRATLELDIVEWKIRRNSENEQTGQIYYERDSVFGSVFG